MAQLARVGNKYWILRVNILAKYKRGWCYPVTRRCRALWNANPMKGIVDDSGRAILPVEILYTKHPTGVLVDVWIDTGLLEIWYYRNLLAS
jgi:hypothetical protein